MLRIGGLVRPPAGAKKEAQPAPKPAQPASKSAPSADRTAKPATNGTAKAQASPAGGKVRALPSSLAATPAHAADPPPSSAAKSQPKKSRDTSATKVGDAPARCFAEPLGIANHTAPGLHFRVRCLACSNSCYAVDSGAQICVARQPSEGALIGRPSMSLWMRRLVCWQAQAHTQLARILCRARRAAR